MSRLPPMCVIPTEADDSCHKLLSSRIVPLRYAHTPLSLAHAIHPYSGLPSLPLSLHDVEMGNSMDGYVHEPDQPQSSPVCSYECQVTVDSTLHRPSCGRLSPSSPVRSSEHQVPIDITTHRSLNERLPSSSPVC